MGEEGEIWRAVREASRQKKQANEAWSIGYLEGLGIRCHALKGSSHYRVGEFSFWPTTGKFYNPKTGQKGRGVRNLVKLITL